MSSDTGEITVSGESLDYFDSDNYDMVSSEDIQFISENHLNSISNETTKNLFYNHLFSSIRQYEEEWNELYNIEELDIDKLQKKSIEGQLRTSRFRSVCWRCLLGILHKQPKQWLLQLEMYRKHYNEICLELEQNPWNVKFNNPSDNPLSQESDSIWQKYFCDEELKAVIHQDVKRTFPGMEFFREADIQQMMVRILFCYARQNPALCYRQGMHEILAPLIFILHCDQQAFLHAREQIPNLDEDISVILNPEYLEQDAYGIFKYIMNHIESSYTLNNPASAGLNCFADTLKCESRACQNEVISRLDFIKKNLLQPTDPELGDHLQNLDIPLHLFGIRWLRLLFGREFPLQDLLVLWDFIFSNNFETVNFIVVAMLIAIREILLSGDYTDCLSNLMRYPSGIDITFIINYALYLKEPLKHLCPDISKNFYNSAKSKKKYDCEGLASQSELSIRLKRRLSGPSRWFSEKPNLHGLGDNGSNNVSSVLTGFVKDDPNVLKAELEQAKTVFNVIHHKLLHFHAVLSVNLQSNINSDVEAALDGILELSCLIKSFSKETSYEIETACEAGETKELKTPNSHPCLHAKLQTAQSSEASINSEKKSHTLPKVKKGLKSGELTVFKHHVGGAIVGVPMVDPLHLIKDLIQNECLDPACTKVSSKPGIPGVESNTIIEFIYNKIDWIMISRLRAEIH